MRPEPDPLAPLDLDRVDFGAEVAPAVRCVACGRAAEGVYFTVGAGGQALCATCQPGVAQWLGAPPTLAALVRATAFGAAAAAVGAAGSWAITEATGYEIGIVAIAIGWGVGWAVRRGSAGPGGRAYQAIAVLLTYAAVVFAYLPPIVGELLADTPERDLPTLLAVAVFAPALALAMPFLAGFENVIGLLIIGFGLWQAWSVTARADVPILGPFRVGHTAPEAAPA